MSSVNQLTPHIPHLEVRLPTLLNLFACALSVIYQDRVSGSYDISHYGADHPLVQRKLAEALDRLLAHIPDSYRPPVEQQVALLNLS